jgi:hypothetical protein
VVFVNGADTKAAQIARSLTSWLMCRPGNRPCRMRISTVNARGIDLERWSNAVAAELLVPIANVPVDRRLG